MGNAWNLIRRSISVFKKYPIFILPILLVWMIYAPSVIYLKYFFPWNSVSISEALGVVFAEIVLFSFIILFSSTLTLELIQQLEQSQSLSLGKAWEEVMRRDLFKIIPLALCWAIIWFILTVIEALLSRRDKDDADDQFDTAHVAETLANYRDFSLSRAFIEALEKGVRMIVFLILPAIAWEDLGPIHAAKKGFRVLKAHLAEFASGYALTYLAAALVFLPPTDLPPENWAIASKSLGW